MIASLEETTHKKTLTLTAKALKMVFCPIFISPYGTTEAKRVGHHRLLTALW